MIVNGVILEWGQVGLIRPDPGAGYVAIYEFGVNLKRISVAFIAALVTLPTFTR